jgi:hypothetical protein
MSVTCNVMALWYAVTLWVCTHLNWYHIHGSCLVNWGKKTVFLKLCPCLYKYQTRDWEFWFHQVAFEFNFYGCLLQVTTQKYAIPLSWPAWLFAAFKMMTKQEQIHKPFHSFIHSTGMCRVRRFHAVLRSFFHSSLLYIFSCHSCPPTILPHPPSFIQ